MKRWLVLLAVAACGKSDECADYAKHVADVTGVSANERKIVEDGLRGLCKDGNVSASVRKCQMAAKDVATLNACMGKPPEEPAPPAPTGTGEVKLVGFKNIGDKTALAAEQPQDQRDWLAGLAKKVETCGGKERLAPGTKWVQVTYSTVGDAPIVMPAGGLPPTVRDCIVAAFEAAPPASITGGSIEFSLDVGK